MKKIKVFVTTNYFCNLNCEYCYLGCLRADKKIIDPKMLKMQFDEIASTREIEEIIVAGGESTLLPLRLLQQIIYTCMDYTDNVNFITNFSNSEMAEAVYGITGNISVSINKERLGYEDTVQKLLSSDLENISLSIVVTPGILGMDTKNLISELEVLKRPVLFLQYSPSIYNNVVYPVANRDHEAFIIGFIKEYLKKSRNFDLLNLQDIENCLSKNEEPWQDSVVFIDPYNRYTGLEYIGNREYFKEFGSIIELEESSGRQKALFLSRCRSCKYFGNCCAEHMKAWDSGDSCCGMKGLLEWYEKNLYKNNGKLQPML